MKYSIIENGVVTNQAVANEAIAPNWIEAGSSKIGDLWDGSVFTSPSPTPLTSEQKLAAIELAIQTHLDAQAKTMGYDSIHTGVTYADEPAVPKFQADGVALRAWRSNVWAAVYTLLAEYEAGTRAEMTPEEVVALLPVFIG